MTTVNKRAWLLAAALLLPQLAGAADGNDRTYFGVSMLNDIYTTPQYNHRSTGLMGRLGYDFSRRLAAEVHVGGSIGPESNANTAIGRAQMDSIYSLFLRLNAYIGTKRLYGLAGMSYGTRVLSASNSAVQARNSDSNKSLGFGLEIYGNRDVSFDFELIRYFDNRYYKVDAFNLGLVTRF
jgi:hypothetical protein